MGERPTTKAKTGGPPPVPTCVFPSLKGPLPHPGKTSSSSGNDTHQRTPVSTPLPTRGTPEMYKRAQGLQRPGWFLDDITSRVVHTVEQSSTYVEDVRKDDERLQPEYQ
eukprot:6455698-Amphidinium_carterae.1